MAIFNASNQLLQIDTGAASTYLYNPTLGFAPWAGLGENQVLGQRYIASIGATAVNPSGQPAIYMLVKYLATSALSTANLTTAGAPAPVYWTDNTFTTVTGITSEAFATSPISFPAGYMLLNTVTGYGNAGTALTGAVLLGAQILIQVGGYLKGAYLSTTTNSGIGSTIIGAAGTLTSTTASQAAGTAPLYPRVFGVELTAVSGNLCDVLVMTDNI
jgi:hypothetical protein